MLSFWTTGQRYFIFKIIKEEIVTLFYFLKKSSIDENTNESYMFCIRLVQL